MDLTSVKDVMEHLKPSGSPFDIVPPWFFKQFFSSIGQAILDIVNSSLSSGVVLVGLKHAVIQPRLKKLGLM